MFFHFPPSKNSTRKQYLQRDCLTFHEQQKLFVCFLFLQENTSRKFLIFLLSYLPVFYCKYRLHLLSFSLIILAFPACTCEPVGIQHSFEFFLRGVRPRCIGLARKTSAHCNTGSYVFSFLFIFIFILFLALSHMHVILIPSVRSLRFGSRL